MATGSTVRFASSLLIGAALGIGSAHYMATPSNPLISDRHGNWYTWPAGGAPDSSPYSQAYFLLKGHLPEHFTEATSLYRSHDDDGGRLSPDCVYLLNMARPGARRWTLSLAGDGGAFSSVMTQDDVISTAGRIEVRLAALPQPGNWLRFGEGAERLVLRMYDGEDRLRQAELDASLPTLRQESCS
ncbi:MAG: DUF1214 domain-containing protein [Anderseniella sp.]|nr:DUF1214 domain-containing protein [Anderseniella sp.]